MGVILHDDNPNLKISCPPLAKYGIGKKLAPLGKVLASIMSL